VFITADDAVRYSRVVEVFDGAKRAGAEVMAMATDLPSAPLAPAPLP
jgi:biopolymer transport protein ExbD